MQGDMGMGFVAARSPLLKPFLPETEKLGEIGMRLALTIIIAILVQRALSLLIRRMEKWVVRAGRGGHHAEQRARTLGQIARNLSGFVVWCAASLRALDVLGWDIRPLPAGAGLVGVVLGFGAQTLVRDIIAGFFILAENQFGVGDLIEINGQAATVEDFNVRRTSLRDFNGYVYFVPNGEMKIVTNRSRGWNRFAVDVLVAADEDLNRALEGCRKVIDVMNADRPWRARLLDPIELWGVESLVGQEVQVRMVVRAKPGPDGPETARELRRRIHLALAETKIRMRSSREIAVLPGVPSTAPTARAS